MGPGINDEVTGAQSSDDLRQGPSTGHVTMVSPGCGIERPDPRHLSIRHVTMISLGGIIGAGLFVGSSSLIRSTGPAVILTYGIAGLIVFLVMRMLAELAMSNPRLGAFTEYTREPLGNWAAFTAGWLYVYFWVTVVGVEALAGAATLQRWLPLPIWSLGLLLLGTMTVVNLMSVRVFGELEFWFASIKVAAIIFFIGLGIWYLAGAPQGRGLSPSIFWRDGGFAPLGMAVVLYNVPTAMFATGGAEIAAVAAADSQDPRRNIIRTTRNVVFRVLAFYISAVIVIFAVVPWDHVVVGYSPFVKVLDVIGLPYASEAINLIVFTAIVSCLNSGIYVTSRVMRGLAQRGDGPTFLATANQRGVPVIAVAITAIGGAGITMLSLISYKSLFEALLSASGAVMLLVYLLIACAQLAKRVKDRAHGVDGAGGGVSLHPALSVGTILMIVGSLVAMALTDAGLLQLTSTLAAAVLLLGIYAAVQVLRRSWNGTVLPVAQRVIIHPQSVVSQSTDSPADGVS